MPLVSKQMVQKTKEIGLVKFKEKGKEKAPFQAKAKRKTTEPHAEGAQKKKLLASTIEAAKRVEVLSSHFLSLMAISSRSELCFGLSLSMLLLVGQRGSYLGAGKRDNYLDDGDRIFMKSSSRDRGVLGRARARGDDACDGLRGGHRGDGRTSPQGGLRRQRP